MSVLVMTDEVREQIKAAIAKALAHPIPLETVKAFAAPNKDHVMLEDRKPGAPKIVERSQQVLLPIGFRAAVSFEVQPMGLCKHLSISVERPGFLPNPAVVTAVAAEFGMIWPDLGTTMWIEEFAPGHNAINLLAPVTTAPGHA